MILTGILVLDTLLMFSLARTAGLADRRAEAIINRPK